MGLVGALLLASLCLCTPFSALGYRWVLWYLYPCLCWILENVIFVPISYSAQDAGYIGLWISVIPEILLVHTPMRYVGSKKCCRHGNLSALLGGRARGLSKQHSDLMSILNAVGRNWRKKYFKHIFIKFDSIRKPNNWWVQGLAPSLLAVWLWANHLISLGLLFSSLIKIEGGYLSYIYLILVRLLD